MAKQERKTPNVLEHDFIITDETVNRYGWRLLVDGINTSAFEKNPVCVVEHDQRMCSIGRWSSLKKENGIFKGTLQFDKNDEHAVYLYWKYTDGYMSAVSLSVLPVSESDNEEDLVAGQRYSTVTSCDLLEISLVTVPAQGNAVKLCYVDGKEYKLNLLTNIDKMEKGNETKTIDQLKTELTTQKKLNADNLIKYHQFRGVVADGELEPLKKLALSDYDNVSVMLEARETQGAAELNSPAESLAESLVKLHFTRGAITEQEKEVYKSSAITSYESTRKILEAKTGVEGVQSFVAGIATGNASAAVQNERASWSYLDWYKKDASALKAMETSEPERYKTLIANFQAENEAMGISGKLD